MIPPRLALVAVLAAVATGLVWAGSSAAGSGEGEAGATQAPAQITPTRVDGVRLGMRHAVLRERGLVGPIRPGCELAGPNTRSARLRAPLRGGVDYTQSNPRRVRSIAVTKGARARGIGIGAKIPRILSRFPNATVDHSTDEVFQLTLVQTPERPSGGRITFGVSTQTKRTTIIGVPFIAFCD